MNFADNVDDGALLRQHFEWLACKFSFFVVKYLPLLDSRDYFKKNLLHFLLTQIWHWANFLALRVQRLVVLVVGAFQIRLGLREDLRRFLAGGLAGASRDHVFVRWNVQVASCAQGFYVSTFRVLTRLDLWMRRRDSPCLSLSLKFKSLLKLRILLLKLLQITSVGYWTRGQCVRTYKFVGLPNLLPDRL